MKLDERKVHYIVRAKERGERSSNLAIQLGCSKRRVEQVYAAYRRDGSIIIPSLKRPGRRRVEISDEERRVVRDAISRYGAGACYLEQVIRRCYGLSIHHMKVYRIMKEEGLLSYRAGRYIKRRWVRYERAHSNSLWHADWHEMKAEQYRGRWLIVIEDDASRFIVGYGIFDSPSSENSVDLLKRVIREQGRPASILTDRGPSFYANESESRERGLTGFELYLMRNHIRHILSRVNHPQTNGKLEKLFDTLERGLAKGFVPMERCIYWYNCMKPHGALELERAETPIEAYYRKMEPREQLVDPGILIKESEIIL